jgi:hypothetical protein
MPPARTYSAAYNRLELDGKDAGPLRSVEGGEPFGEVVQAAVGAGNVIRKRIAALRYADISIECGLIPSGPVANLISATLGRSFHRHSGAVVEHDDNYRETSRLAFEDATIHEVEFPALHASQQEPAYLTIRLAPDRTERQTGSGAQQPKDPDMIRGARTKPPRRCDFRLQIDGLDATRVSAVSPLVVRQVIAERMPGEQRVYDTPALEIPDLVVTLAEAADWYAWRDAFLVGATGPERTGKLEYLSPDRKDALAWIEFSGLGIHSLVRERSEEGAQGIRQVRASMYCGNLSYGPVVAPSPAAAAPDASWERLTPPSRVDVTVPLAREGVLARPEFV